MNHSRFLTRCVCFCLLVIAAVAFFVLATANGAPLAARSGHTAVWSGNEMLVWSGTGTSGQYLNDGARYDPVANYWSAVNLSGAPAGRDSSMTVWTGSDMIVWGGFGSLGASGNGPVNTGGNYIPMADSWTATTTITSPTGRFGHTAVWTGTEMIVWGGYNFISFAALNDGGRYDPLTDSWTNTTTTGAPVARYSHAAVWTGNRMIVWGGIGTSGYLNDGGRYNPVSNSWTAVTNTGTPAAREFATAVWTGNEMIIWGGYNGSSLNSGGRYNPAGNSWAAITNTGTPSPRYNHTVVWTGSKMIVWGGNNGSVPLNDGGIYNPLANSWTPVSTIGAPSARYYHTAVWTGTEMIVWGGANGSTRLNDGGRYNPATDTWTPLPSCPDGFPDNFACRPTIFGTNISFSTSNVGATAEPGEPSHGLGYGTDAGASLWYSWTAPFSGGVVITANSSFPTPLLAAYTGDSFATLTRVASNNTQIAESRLAFTAAAGTNYQIVVDGTAYTTSGQGSLNVNLTLTPAPANDFFANRTPISGPFFETSASVIGASREPGEPDHTNIDDVAAWPQTLWWSWTAPTNLGVSGIPVKLIAEGTDFLPNIGVYTGTSISNLTNVALTVQAARDTHLADFTAVAGATYQIAVGGNEDYPALASVQLGNYYFRLNIHALVLSFANINATTNADDSVSFDADFQVIHFGSASSSALRVQVKAISGQYFSQDAALMPDNQIPLLTVNLPALDPGQGLVRHISTLVPAPIYNHTNTTTYSDYAELQEQVGANWLTLDQTLVLVGHVTKFRVGGGVIRVDPGVTGAAFNPLTNVIVMGPLTIPEGSTAAYLGRARYANGFQYDFSNTVWTTTLFSITNGLLTTGSVTSNSPAILDAKYSNGGFTYDAPDNIVILDLPPPSWSGNIGVSNKQFQALLTGVPGRKHVVEATTNLSVAATWIPLSTNVTATNGIWLFLDPGATNFTRRFYRARESQ